MNTLDTSGLYVLLNRADRDRARVVAAFARERGPALVPVGILSEICYLIETRLSSDVLDVFLDDLAAGRFTPDCGDRDLPRVRELVRRYADLPLGFADACVVACAERNGGRVLTLDHRHEASGRSRADSRLGSRSSTSTSTAASTPRATPTRIAFASIPIHPDVAPSGWLPLRTWSGSIS